MADPIWVDGTTPLNSANMTKLQTRDEKAAANGYPSLDGTGKVPAAQLPAISSVDYAGAYNPGTTYHAGEYVVGADGITYQCVKDGTVGVSPTPWAPAPTISYGTSLPASPVDGQEAVLVDSATNPSYQWRFRYNAGSSSAYKWEFIGGIPFQSFVAAGMTPPSNTWTATTPSFVVPRSGEYLFSLGSWINLGSVPATTPINNQVSLWQAGASVSDSVAILLTPGNLAAQSNWIASVANSGVMVVCTSGQTIQLAVFGTNTISTFSNRDLVATPRRVS